MWNAEYTKQIENARRAVPNDSLQQFRALAAAISDITAVGARQEPSTYEMLKPETRALLTL